MNSKIDLKNANFITTEDRNRLGLKITKRSFFCPLCKTERELKYSSKLTKRHYAQIVVLSVAMGWIMLPVLQAKVIILFFMNWIFFETVNKILFRKQIPCDDCGFDATWYRKDVKVARQKVKNYWDDVKAEKAILQEKAELINEAKRQVEADL
jgi:hypothetical protein